MTRVALVGVLNCVFVLAWLLRHPRTVLMMSYGQLRVGHGSSLEAVSSLLSLRLTVCYLRRKTVLSRGAPGIPTTMRLSSMCT